MEARRDSGETVKVRSQQTVDPEHRKHDTYTSPRSGRLIFYRSIEEPAQI